MFNKLKSLIKTKNKRLLIALYAAPALAAMSIVLVSVPMIQNGARVQGIDAVANSPADVVIGQADMTSNLINQVGYGKTLNYPNVIIKNGSKLFVADCINSRVLIYNSIPTTNNAAADVVIGQADMTHVSTNQGGSVGANTLYYPQGVYTDGTKLFIADTYNHRVLIYNSIPTNNNVSAEVVIGQPNMASNTANNGGINANTLQYPVGVYGDGTRLFIADEHNHRVLIFNTVPTSNNAAADVVIGQANMTSNGINGGLGTGICAANTLYYPSGVCSSGTKLFVADYFNNRVLIFNNIPTSNNSSASFEIGQTGMVSNSINQGMGASACGANTLYKPNQLYCDGTKLFVADMENRRLLIYGSIPASNNVSAEVVVGQADMTHNSANQGGSAGANTIYSSRGVFSDGSKLFISDGDNNRVLIYNSIPTINNASANTVIGQQDMTHNVANQSTTSIADSTLYSPRHIHSDGTRLFVADCSNNRVLIYNSIPAANNPSADIVLGQANMTSGYANRGGSRGAHTLSSCNGVFYDGTKLFIADSLNNRVLIYNSMPTANGASAEVVIGQADMTSGSINRGGSVSDNTLYYPTDIFSDGTKLFIADNLNHRVLIYNTVPTVNGASADTVIGQADMTHNSADRGGSAGADTLHAPHSMYSDGTRLYISDNNNHRLLIFNSIPTVNGASADIVVGQTDMTSSRANRGGRPGANTLYTPHHVTSDGTRLFISEYDNNRVLIYNAIPAANGESADIVVGQADMTHNSANQAGNAGSNTLSRPIGLVIGGNNLYVSDSDNNRILIYNLTTTKPVISDIKFNDVTYKPGDTINTLPVLKATLSDTGGVGGIYINNLKITIDSTLYTYASFDASTDSYDSTTGLMTFKTKTALAAGTHSFKIEISDYLGNWETWEATDLQVKAATDVAVEGTPLAYPNPAKPSVQSAKITYTLTTDHDISVYLFNMQGRLIWKRNYSSGSMGGKAGYNEVSWNGRDDFDTQVGNGIYLFRIVSQGKIIGKGKIAVIE